MSWYRDDFSDRTLDEVMATLRAHPVVEPVTIPESAESIGMWLKPADEYPLITARLVVEDGRNQVASLALGNVGPPEWHLVSADIPSRLRHPLRLVSVQIFEPGQGPVGTPGALLLDDNPCRRPRWRGACAGRLRGQHQMAAADNRTALDGPGVCKRRRRLQRKAGGPFLIRQGHGLRNPRLLPEPDRRAGAGRGQHFVHECHRSENRREIQRGDRGAPGAGGAAGRG